MDELKQNNPNNSKAPNGVLSLVCGIAGLAALFLFCILPDDEEIVSNLILFPSIAACIVGMVTGIVGSKKIKGHENEYSNSNLLTVGKILGIVGIAIWAALLTLGFFYLLLTGEF